MSTAEWGDPAGSDPPDPPDPPVRPDPPVQPVQPVREVDCRGQRCPLPVIALARQLPELAIGEVLRLRADDPAAANDVPAWCRLRGQELLYRPAPDTFDIRRRH